MGNRTGLRDGMRGMKRSLPVITMGAGAVLLAAGLVVPAVAAQGPETVAAALEAYSNTSVTFTVTPAYATTASVGAWVSIMDPNTGTVYSHTKVNQALTSGTPATITVPISNLPADERIASFTSFVEIPGSSTQAVVLAAETIPQGLPPIPIPPPHTPPPIPSPPPTSSTVTPPGGGGTTTTTVVLPKTGAGPALEVGGVLLLLAGGLMLVVRPRRS